MEFLICRYTLSFHYAKSVTTFEAMWVHFDSLQSVVGQFLCIWDCPSNKLTHGCHGHALVATTNHESHFPDTEAEVCLREAEICLAGTRNCVNFAELVPTRPTRVPTRHLCEWICLTAHIRMVDFSLNIHAVEQQLM